MNLKKLFSFSGAILLAFVSILALARSPKANVTTLYYTVLGVCKSFTVFSSSFTTGGTTTQSSIIPSSGTAKALWGACSSGIGSHAVHMHH